MYNFFFLDKKTLSDLAKMYRLKVWNMWIVLSESLRREIEISDVEAILMELDERRHKLRHRHVEEMLRTAKLIASHRPKGEPKAKIVSSVGFPDRGRQS